MIDTYTSSKGETILIKDMASPHLIHSIAKVAKNIGGTLVTAEDIEADEELLKALKAEAIYRLAPKEKCKGCDKDFVSSHGALSRYNHGSICSDCGTREAFEGDFISIK